MRQSRILTIAASLSILVLVMGCTKGRSSAPEVETALSRSGIVSVQGAPFYAESEGAAEKLEWRAALDFGESVKLARDAKPRTFSVGGESMELVPVERAGGDGWIKSAHFAGDGAEPAVAVAGEAAVREAPAADGKLRTSLPRLTLIAAVRGAAEGWVKARVIDAASKRPYDAAYIAAADLSFKRDDVSAAILLAKAGAARDAGAARALAEEAERSFAGSAFGAEIKAALGGGEEEAGGPAIEEIKASLVSKTEGAIIRSDPSATAAEKGKLALDEEIGVTGRTVDVDTVDGATARWYRIDSPAEGWVFGRDIEGAD